MSPAARVFPFGPLSAERRTLSPSRSTRQTAIYVLAEATGALDEAPGPAQRLGGPFSLALRACPEAG
jgi:hypothetical protein